MTAKLIKSILVMAMAATLTAGISAAGERMKAYEMGESGQVVLFAMTPEEIAAEDAESARLNALRQTRLAEPMMATYELAESGAVISFPMTAEEIEAVKKQAAEKAAKSSASEKEKAKKPNVVVEKYELCECGEIISFTRPKTEAEKLPVDQR